MYYKSGSKNKKRCSFAAGQTRATEVREGTSLTTRFADIPESQVHQKM